MENIRDIIRAIVKDDAEIYSTVCIVNNIDMTTKTVTASPVNGNAKIFDVRLQSGISGTVGVVIYPKVGSEVLVSYLSKETAYIALFGEIDQVEVVIGEMSLFLDAENLGIEVKNTSFQGEYYNITATEKIEMHAKSNIAQGETVDWNFSDKVEANAARFKFNAPLIELIGAVIKLQGDTIGTGTLVYNGGANGGFAKTAALALEINKLKDDLKDLNDRIAAFAPSGTAGDGANLWNVLNAWTPTTAHVTQASISNDQLKH